jgi:hypothetical protein
MRLMLKRVLIAVVALAAALYAYDYLSVQHRMAAQQQGDPFDTVTFPHILAIPQKGNRVEYAIDAIAPMQWESCIHSIFPHYGYTPCWYVRRATKRFTPMVILISPYWQQ